MDENFVLCDVHGVKFDSLSNVPVVLLKEKETDRFLPIWIGMFEATQIEIALDKVKVPRPMSHDLMKSFLDTFNLHARFVRIHDIIDGTFHAKIMVSVGGGDELVPIDARPSDAIALSLRTMTPIYVARKIIDEAAVSAKQDENQSENQTEDEAKQFHDFVQSLKPNDFKSQ